MRNLFIVMKFTMKEMVRKKAFIVSTILILLMIVIGFCIPKIIKAIKGEETKDKIIIVDSQNIFEGNLELLKQINPEDYEIIYEVTWTIINFVTNLIFSHSKISSHKILEMSDKISSGIFSLIELN